MPLVHQQTWIQNVQPLVKTNWTNTESIGSSRVATGGSSPTIYPQVGSYMMYQLPVNGGVPPGANSSYLQYNNSYPLTTGQYTIEGWVNVTPPASWQTSPIDRRMIIGSGNNRIEVVFSQNTPTNQYSVFAVYYEGGTNRIIANGMPLVSFNTWVYFAVVKDDNSRRFLMINGQLVGNINTSNFTEALTWDTTALKIGKTGSELGALDTIPAYFDQIRISNIARYSAAATYTPPTTAFTNDVNTWYLCGFETFPFDPAPSPT